MGRVGSILWMWAAVWMATPSYGQSTNVTAGKVLPVAVRVTPLFDGLVRENEPAVLRLEAVNSGPDLRGAFVYDEIKLDQSKVQWRQAVEIPENGRKEWSFVYRPDWQASQSIRLEGLVEPLSVDFQVRVHGERDVLIGVVGLDAQGVNGISETFDGRVPAMNPLRTEADHALFVSQGFRLVRVGLTEPAALPLRSEGYRALNWLVWPNADPSTLTPEQVDAILGWVAEGGHLFLTVSDTYRQVTSSPLSDALPFRLTELVDVDTLGGFTEAVGSRGSHDGVVPVAVMEQKDEPGRSQWTLATLAGGQPAWGAGTYGLGTIHMVPMNLRNQVIQDGVDLQKMWRHLLWLPPKDAPDGWFGYRGKNPSYPEAVRRKGRHSPPPLGLIKALNVHSVKAQGLAEAQDSSLNDAEILTKNGIAKYLVDIPGVAPLPLSWLLAFALVYLFFIGPFDYLLLKKLGKQPWTWVTFPTYIVVFSAVAMIGTSLAKGDQAVIKRIDVVDVLPGTSYARGSSMIGVFATGRTRVKLASEFSSGFTEPALSDGGFMESVQKTQGMGSRSLSWGTQTWTLAFARTQWVEPLADLDITLEMTSAGQLSIYNRSDVSLRGCRTYTHRVDEEWRFAVVGPGDTQMSEPLALTDRLWGEFLLNYDADNLERWAVNMGARFKELGRGSLVDLDFEGVLVCVSDKVVDNVQVDGLSGQEDTVNLIRVPFKISTEFLE